MIPTLSCTIRCLIAQKPNDLLVTWHDRLDWAVRSLRSEENSNTLTALLMFRKKYGKCPDSLDAILDFVIANPDHDPYLQHGGPGIELEIEAIKEDEMAAPSDAEAMIRDVYQKGRERFYFDTYHRASMLAAGSAHLENGIVKTGAGENRLGASDDSKPVISQTGIDAAQQYVAKRMSKDLGVADDSNGLWHENTDAIVETLNEKAKGAVIETLIPAMDDNWMLKLGKTLLIAGTSGDGKTTLMLSLLYNFALQGHNVVLFTLEDPQVDVWVKLAFIHTARFKEEFDLPSLFEWEQRSAFEAAGKNRPQWLTDEEKANMRDVIMSIKSRDKVPGLIDVQPINEWSKMKAYTQGRMAENKYSIMAVDYFGERMQTPGDPKWRDKELNAAAGEAINFAQENNLLLVAPVQVKKNLRDAFAAEYVDVPNQNSGFVAPYGDIAAVKADQIQALPQGADYCIGVWSGDELKKKNQGLICCMKFRPTVPFPTFRFKVEKSSKYVRDASRVRAVVERSVELSTVKYDISQEM